MMVVAVLLILMLGLIGGTVAVQALERRPRRPSEEERRANVLRIVETRYARGNMGLQELKERRRELKG